MESIAEGITLCFVGVLVLLVTSLAGAQSQTAYILEPLTTNLTKSRLMWTKQNIEM